MIRYFTLTFLIVLGQNIHVIVAQNAMDSLMNELLPDEPVYVNSVFKSSRILNSQSVKQPAAGELEFRISHRFGKLNSGGYELWGLDHATIHFSLEYNPLKFITVGAGRSSYRKTYDGFIKINVLRQQEGQRSVPLFITYFSSMEAYTLRNEIVDFNWKHRISYTQQLLIARKFSQRLSMQIMPTLVHKNLTLSNEFMNDIYALGFGGRFKLTNRLSLNAEAYMLEEDFKSGAGSYYQPIALGVDIETGGHVFQLIVTNSLPMREAGFITETKGSWSQGDIYFGFNISRTFHLHD